LKKNSDPGSGMEDTTRIRNTERYQSILRPLKKDSHKIPRQLEFVSHPHPLAPHLGVGRDFSSVSVHLVTHTVSKFLQDTSHTTTH
jgi:hypothetical protein